MLTCIDKTKRDSCKGLVPIIPMQDIQIIMKHADKYTSAVQEYITRHAVYKGATDSINDYQHHWYVPA